MVTNTAYKWHEVDDLTFQAYQALCDYWQGFPPVNESVAAYLGIKPKGKAKTDNLGELLDMFPTGEIKHG